MSESRTQLPPRVLPLLYFAAAHIAIGFAFAAVSIDPRGVAGFFYHARMLAIVHLVTLGWITSSILGALYLVGPIALRAHFPATARDYTAFALVTIGIVGMVGHFWIESYSGMAWSACTVLAGILIVATRVIPPLLQAPVPNAVRAHIVFAFANIAGAGVLGILIGFDKVYHFLPGFILANVIAHAHLAAIGWATLMVIGVGYRLLPMVLPSEMPAGPHLWTTVTLIETGTIGLVATILTRSPLTILFATLIAAGLATFFLHAAWMIRRPRRRPAAVPTPDPAIVHAGAAFASLAAAAAIGLWLAAADMSAATLRLAMVYGVLGLVGFLAQMVVAMNVRLIALHAWYWASVNTGGHDPVPSPHDMASNDGQILVAVLWLFGVPSLAIGFGLDAVPFVRGGAVALLAATIVESANLLLVVRHAFMAPGRRLALN